MKLILVVDDMAVFREPIAASLRLAGYNTLCAADGEEALRTVRATRPDLILLDVSMPKMDGISFLKCLRADPANADIRVILLTAVSEKKHVLAASALGVRDYLLKSRFGLKELLERIEKQPSVPAVATTGAEPKSNLPSEMSQPPTSVKRPPANVPIQQVLTREQFLERIEGALEGKALSGVISQVIALASSPRGEMTQLATLIARDPTLSARVLQAANSAAYSSAGAVVTTINEAIKKVGCAGVRNIAAAIGVFDCVPEAGADGFNPIRCWQHSFAVAQLCERLASIKFADQSGMAYVIGLCHDLGDIFIRSQFSKEYQQVIDASAQTGQPMDQLLQKMLGLTHAQMIRAVFKCMGLPDAIREPIQLFHSTGASKATDPMARILWMAENCANAAMIASNLNSEISPLPQSLCRAAVGEPNPPRPEAGTLRSEVLTLTVMLAHLSRADEAKLLVPLFPKRPANIWLAREPGISEFDPILMALESLTDVAVNKRLPTAQETGEIDGLVVVATSSNSPGFSQRDIDGSIVKRRANGGVFPVLPISADNARPPQQAEGGPWRSTVALAELAAFVDSCAASQASEAA
jgi:CheY-like chemotaxis protein